MLFFTLISIILFFFCLYLYFDNKKLKQKITNLEQETKTILERKIINSKEDLVSMENISIDKTSLKEETNASKNSTLKTESKESNQIPSSALFIHPNKKYTAKTNEDEYIVPNIPKPTSSILNSVKSQPDNINKQLNPVNPENIPKPARPNLTNNLNTSSNPTVSMTIDFNPNEFIKADSNVLPKTMDNTSRNDEYLKEIAKQIEDELTPQTADLTDYEKDQEEHAIISYQELLSLKEKNNNEEKKDKSFLEDLKTLRNLLDKQNT